MGGGFGLAGVTTGATKANARDPVIQLRGRGGGGKKAEVQMEYSYSSGTQCVQWVSRFFLFFFSFPSHILLVLIKMRSFFVQSIYTKADSQGERPLHNGMMGLGEEKSGHLGRGHLRYQEPQGGWRHTHLSMYRTCFRTSTIVSRYG